MAKVFAYWECSVTLVDQGAQSSTRTYRLRDAQADDASVTASTLLGYIEALTRCEVTAFRVSQVWVEDSIALPTDAQLEDNVVLTVDIASNPLKRATLSLPAPQDAIFVGATGPNNNVVDLTNADVLAFVDAFKSAGVASISDGEDVGQVLDGVRVHRRSGRSRSRRIG